MTPHRSSSPPTTTTTTTSSFSSSSLVVVQETAANDDEPSSLEEEEEEDTKSSDDYLEEPKHDEDDHPHDNTNKSAWSSRGAYLSALLSVNLSQLWRTSALIGSNNSSSHSPLICMVFVLGAIVLIGLPLLLLELALGQAYQEGAVGMWQLPYFGSSKRWTTSLGLVSLLIGFIMSAYGVAMLSWMVHAFVDTFFAIEWTSTENVFLLEFIGQSTLELNKEGNNDNTAALLQPTRLVVDNVIYTVLIWGLVWLGASMGIARMGRLCMFMTSLSTVLLVTLWGKSLSFEQQASSSGSFGRTTTSFSSGDLLAQAITQTIYTTGLALGIMSTHASCYSCHSNTNTNNTPKEEPPVLQIASAVSVITAFFVLLTGYSMAAAIGSYNSNDSDGNDDHDNNGASVGPAPGPFRIMFSTVFVQWPAALMGNAQAENDDAFGSSKLHWVRILYLTFFLLGVQFGWAVLTAIITVLRDANAVPTSVARWKIAGTIALIGCLVSLVFTTDAGFLFMESTDYYVTLLLLALAFAESFAAGWLGQIQEQTETFGILPIVTYIIANFGSVIVAAAVWFGFATNDVDHANRLWVGFFGGCVVFLLGMACTLLSLQHRYDNHYLSNLEPTIPAMTPWQFYLDFCNGNVLALKESLEQQQGGVGSIPDIWCHIMKHFVPHILLMVLIRHILYSVHDNSSIGFGKYYGLPISPTQILGIAVVVLAVILVLLGVVAPQVFAALIPPPTMQFVNRRDTMEDVEETAGESSESVAELSHMDEPVVLDGEEDPIE